MENDPQATFPVGAESGAAEKWEPARQRVYEYVRDGILDGRLAGGSFLEEEQVSLAVGVSRTPVREAFQQLHSERLIDLVPRRGAMVRAVTVQELVEVSDPAFDRVACGAPAVCCAAAGAPGNGRGAGGNAGAGHAARPAACSAELDVSSSSGCRRR